MFIANIGYAIFDIFSMHLQKVNVLYFALENTELIACDWYTPELITMSLTGEQNYLLFCKGLYIEYCTFQIFNPMHFKLQRTLNIVIFESFIFRWILYIFALDHAYLIKSKWKKNHWDRNTNISEVKSPFVINIFSKKCYTSCLDDYMVFI